MKKILIFSGTTEGRELSELLAENGFSCTVSVATEYGEVVMPENDRIVLHKGRMEKAEMSAFIREGGFDVVVDATHPYALEVTENIRESLVGMEILYLRLERGRKDIPGTKESDDRKETASFSSAGACVEALRHTTGNILLTTGSKDLSVYCKEEALRERLFVRVLPAGESLEICEKNGIKGRQIIAMQGPFHEELNRALIRQFEIRHLVTKESGKNGGFEEKVQAASKEGVKLYVIGNPGKENTGLSMAEVCRKISEYTKTTIKNSVDFIGMGMGTKGSLTAEAAKRLRKADVLFGAKRLVEEAECDGVKIPCYLPEEITAWLDKLSGSGLLIAVLFSGDTGFYSGCTKVYQAVKERDDCVTEILPGISSVSALSAKTGIPWQDAGILSIHGKKMDNVCWGDLLFEVRHREKNFILLSGAKDLAVLGELLVKEGLESCEVFAGYHLSYLDQEIQKLTPKQCMNVTKEGLYVCLVVNRKPEKKRVVSGVTDDFFIRGKVPMTKEEIRVVSLAKLGLCEDSILYDIGSGTGSIAVEAALSGPGITVFALEKKKEACALILKNKEKAKAYRVNVIEGDATDTLRELMPATHAFIGGSGGRLQEILTLLYEKNPSMRVVITAISLETIAELAELKENKHITELETIQVQVSRSRTAGNYQLMQAENPVYICSFQFEGERKCPEL